MCIRDRSRHPLDALGEADTEPFTERVERLAVTGHERVSISIAREDLEDDFELDPDLGLDVGTQAVPPGLDRQVNGGEPVLTEPGDCELIRADEVVVAQSIFHGDTVTTDIDDLSLIHI